jgi:D-tyrosyl-tRNA(Tyr) deacylase
VKIVLQRVKSARVTVDGNIVSAIGRGILVLIGVHADDTIAQADFLAAKCAEIRIFPNSSGKMDVSLSDSGGEALIVSQFTLLADCRKGRRPSFIEAADPEKGEKLYMYFVEKLKEKIHVVKTGVFGAMMDVELVNDGPVTILLNSEAGTTLTQQ